MHVVFSTRSGQVFSRVILPLVLFVAIIGGVAWVIQYMPGAAKPARVTQDAKGAASANAAPLMSFKQEQALWDAKDETYIKEFERGQEGSYEFPFVNLHDGPLEVGMNFANCDCTRVEICFLPADECKQYLDKKTAATLPWKTLTKSDTEFFVMEKGYHGIARANWKSSKQPGEQVTLWFSLWYQPRGQLALRQKTELRTPILTVHPVAFFPKAISLGTVRDDVSAQFYGWSPTRADVKLTLDDKRIEPCFDYKVESLTVEELPQLQQHLREQKINTRVKAGVRVSVTVHENTKDRFLDQGHFRHVTPFLLDGEEYAGPVVSGTVRGDVEVGGADDNGKINLKSFKASLGIKKIVSISADPKTKVTLEGATPDLLKTKLVLSKEKSSKDRNVWDLHVEVPASTLYGELPEDSSIILKSQNTQTRKIRVPVSGLAGQG